MLGIKKLDQYILKKFFPLFVGAFFICLFVFMMQFTWRYIDELIGKGLSIDLLAEFFWHMGVSLIPMSLPLAVLLASLITFGNMGEQLELLSMKAAGVSLLRIMRPIMIFIFLLTGFSFYFQNTTAPQAQINLRTLLFSMKQAQPAVEIPEGVFYNEVPGLNLYVTRKDVKTGMLYNVIIYKTDQGFDRAQIVLADSGRLEMTADKMHLTLDLWQGEQFENLKQQSTSLMSTTGVPYDREAFSFKRFLIDFDSNFALLDKEMLRNLPSAKSMWEIESSIDSVNHELDSVGGAYYEESRQRWYARPAIPKTDSAHIAKMKTVGLERMTEAIGADRQQRARQIANQTISSRRAELEWKSVVTDDGDRYIRLHLVEWHTKITLALSCLLFFFVGAPLGAIIRKGGLGMPAVVSVLIFIFYYIINTSGMKMARDGSWSMVYGMWISSVLLLPFGVFLTYKANKDSVVFNAELYATFFRNLLGLRSQRHIARKEVIIEDPDYDRLPGELQALGEACRTYNREHRLMSAPNYFKTFFRHVTDHQVVDINEQMERIVEELSNSRDARIMDNLNRLPIIFTAAHTSPFERRWTNVAAGLLFPLGLILWIRIWRFRLRLLRDLRLIAKTCDRLEQDIRHLCGEDNEAEYADEETSAPASAPRVRHPWRRRVALLVLLAALFAAGWYAYRYQQRARAKERDVPARSNFDTAPADRGDVPRSLTRPAVQ